MTRAPPTQPSPWTARGARAWMLRLDAAPAAVTAALRAVASGQVQVLSRQPGRIVLRCDDGDTALRVAVLLRADGEHTIVTAVDEGRGVGPDHVKAALLAGFVLCLGLGMPSDLPIRSLMFAASLPSLMFLIASHIDAARHRPADFRRALQAVDRAVASLRSHDPRPYRALAGRSERRGQGRDDAVMRSCGDAVTR